MEQTDDKQERRCCARLGWALVLTAGCALVWPVLLMLLALSGVLRTNQTLYYLLTLVGYYLIALPLSYRLCRCMPAPPLTNRWVQPRLIGRWFVIGVALMWLGSLIGSALNDLTYRIAGLEPADLLTDMMQELPLAVILLGACVLGPLCEELLFRGLLARRLARYGQKPAALVSALLFGLYHANLSQLFYAFALGLLLAYAYFYTGTLCAPVLLHMLLNTYGSFLAFVLPENSLLAVLYGLSWPVLSVAGMILLVRGRRQQVWEHGPCAPSMRVVFGSAGMTLAIVICFVQAAMLFAG